jgi:hypothetical protein
MQYPALRLSCRYSGLLNSFVKSAYRPAHLHTPLRTFPESSSRVIFLARTK